MTAVTIEDASNLRALAEQSHAWPFEEARKIVARLKKRAKDEVIFETGYGPSGLPHIGTFGEVARTTMVRHAFRVLTDDKIKTRLIAFSDDMDGLRKVPDNIPNKEMVAQHLNKPLTEVPDPFGTHGSFGEHNNARLRAFLDQFGFDYEFMSSTACYTSGRFDEALLKVLAHFDQVMAIMLPSLREERAQSYSPFLPISPRTRSVLQVPVLAHDAKAGTITYEDPDTRERVTTPVTGGRCKLQWKPDWAMRWVALGVDYEMAGKDLIDSVKLSGEICRALGGVPPEGFNYELFLDETGQKISKSKGNGLTIDEWLRYASPESLSLFMYREPKAAKRLYFDVIPRNVDEYYQFLDAYERQGPRERLSNPVWHIHSGAPPKIDNPVPFAMLLSLVTASNAENADTLWGFIGISSSSSITPFTTSATSCCWRRDSASRAIPSVPRSSTCAMRCRNCGPTPTRRPSKMWSTKSAAANPSSITRRRPRTASRASRSTGSTCSIRCCSARRKARASAPSSPPTASRTPST
jgi:lysyl-tRNA synthetase class 1